MKINENSTKPCYIDIYYNDILISSATGFQIHYFNKYLITNWHVVTGRNFITNKCLDQINATIPNKIVVTYKKYINNNNFKWVKRKIDLYDSNNNPIWYEHPKYGKKVDVVAIPLETNPNYLDYRERFELDTNYTLDVTESLFVVGFPLGYTIKSKDEPHAIWTSGTIASDPSLDIVINGETLPAFIIDSRTRQGQSGSPVIYYSESGFDPNYNNGFASWNSPFMKEIGIYTGRINKECDLGYVWKWKVIKEIVESIIT